MTQKAAEKRQEAITRCLGFLLHISRLCNEGDFYLSEKRLREIAKQHHTSTRRLHLAVQSGYFTWKKAAPKVKRHLVCNVGHFEPYHAAVLVESKAIAWKKRAVKRRAIETKIKGKLLETGRLQSQSVAHIRTAHIEIHPDIPESDMVRELMGNEISRVEPIPKGVRVRNGLITLSFDERPWVFAEISNVLAWLKGEGYEGEIRKKF